MEKHKAVASMGQNSLLLPAWITAALLANDRLKLYLSVLQSAATHAADVQAPLPDWSAELRQHGQADLLWLGELAANAYMQDSLLVLPQIETLTQAMADDLETMAKPVCEFADAPESDFCNRRGHWIGVLERLQAQAGLRPGDLGSLTHGEPARGDSLHLLVMDLHKRLNALAAQIATENIDGAHVWQIEPDDRPLIEAFMRGLQRTAPLKFGHPGLATAVTRHGKKLLIQNDIGTNDAHVLVLEVQGKTVRLTYSDLHQVRFDFFRLQLEALGFTWEVLAPQTVDGLNQGKPYVLGHATLQVRQAAALLQGLEATASRIVFLIDWNRARKRLQLFVSKPLALEVLTHCAQTDVGHMGWLLAGGEQLVYGAMQAVDSHAFRVGERLDQVLGEAAARQFLQALLTEASFKLRQQLPTAMVQDEARLLLARAMRQRSFEFDLLAEHAALQHAIATEVCRALSGDAGADPALWLQTLNRAKAWEHQADQILTTARERTRRHERWLPLLELLGAMDDVADTLEESVYLLHLLHTEPLRGLPAGIVQALQRLAETTLA
ncbi:MAG: phosphate transport regulator, partial [Serpentinimonas sp.]|nr:phosphate transport regulator [Serpentinimonas sp.]